MFYGTLESEAPRAKREKKILLLDIDVNGAKEVKTLKEEALYVFIDSGDDLGVYKERILKRGREKEEEQIKRRLTRIPYELKSGRENADIRIKNSGSIEEYYHELNIVLFLEELNYFN